MIVAGIHLGVLFWSFAAVAACLMVAAHTRTDMHVIAVVLGLAVFAQMTRGTWLQLGSAYLTVLSCSQAFVAVGFVLIWALLEHHVATAAATAVLGATVFVIIREAPAGIRVMRAAFGGR